MFGVEMKFILIVVRMGLTWLMGGVGGSDGVGWMAMVGGEILVNYWLIIAVPVP